MSKSSLINRAKEIYKNTAMGSWVLGVTTGLLIAAILALDLVLPFLSAITVPLLIVPIVLSAIVQHIMLRRGQNLTVLGSLRSFSLYYTSTFFGCFSIILSFLKSLLVFLVLEFIVSSVVSTLFQIYSPAFVSTMTSFVKLIEEPEFSSADLMKLLEANGGILNIYLIVVFAPTFLITCIFFIYTISRNSLNVYLKMNLKNANMRFVKLIYSDTLRRNRFRMLKDYFLLNWPLYLLLVLGFSGGAVLGFFWKGEINIVISCALILGMILVSFFLPFYFANNEALFEKYEPQFKLGVTNIANMMVERLQQNIELTVDEKNAIEKTLSEAKNPLDDNNENDEGNEE